MRTLRLLSLLLFVLACQPDTTPTVPPPAKKTQVQAVGLDGVKYHVVNDAPVIQETKDSLLNIAYKRYLKDTTSLNHIIWYGRRLAYLTRYQEAISVFTKGMKIHPNAPELYRHRGHRYISIRKPIEAVDDLMKAARLVGNRPIQMEPDGIPNRLNRPVSSLQFNIWYHLGLAHYLQQNYKEAQIAYETCMNYSTNPDLRCATTDWLYMTYRRRGLTEKPKKLLEAIEEDMVLIENTAYHKRLLMYKGLLSPDDILTSNNSAASRQLDMATQGYGVGNWYLYNGEAQKAVDIFHRILKTSYWPAFGYLAAESDLEYLRARYPGLF